MIGIGIDTGGTCTDAVIYDHGAARVLASAKCPTTHDDLRICIRNILDKMPPELCRSVDYVALSTTLATNACVEGKGARAGLIFIGAYAKVVQDKGYELGLPPLPELCLIDGAPGDELDIHTPEFEAELKAKFSGMDSVAIAQSFPERDGGAQEREVAAVVERVLGLPCVLSSTLFSKPNILRRGASAMLNARLIPIMSEFIDSVRTVLSDKGIKAPVWIVRSDGTLMSTEFAMTHPVETLLCGPASSVIGGQFLSKAENSLIIDMGGTTTDISVVRGGVPISAAEGVDIGTWRTSVEGVYIKTFGLGGDSRVVRNGGAVELEPVRCIPLCSLASAHPQVLPVLRELAETAKPYALPLHEFFVLQKRQPNRERYEPQELAVCDALEDGPLSLAQLAERTGCMMDVLPVKRLEKEGVILRAGITPTDVMHLRGRFTAFDRRASEYGISWLAASMGLTVDELCDRIDDAVVNKMYRAVTKILIEKDPRLPVELRRETTLGALTEYAYRQVFSRDGSESTDFRLRSSARLVGIGAPTSYYLKRAAKLLEAEAVIPEYASTANALGAAVSCISAVADLELRPGEEKNEYLLTGGAYRKAISAEELSDAIDMAEATARELASEKARSHGALGKLAAESTFKKVTADIYGIPTLLRVEIHASARASLQTD